MIHLHEAIYALNPSVTNINGDIAYDINKQEVVYDKDAAEVKLVELQAAEEAKQQQEQASKESALSKLTALGLTQAEVKALLGL